MKPWFAIARACPVRRPPLRPAWSLTGGLEIGPDQTVELKPGTLPAILVNLPQGLRQGETVKGMLVFEKAGVVKIEYQVGGIGAQVALAVANAHQNH